jgi:hypothetical protein
LATFCFLNSQILAGNLFGQTFSKAPFWAILEQNWTKLFSQNVWSCTPQFKHHPRGAAQTADSVGQGVAPPPQKADRQPTLCP